MSESSKVSDTVILFIFNIFLKHDTNSTENDYYAILESIGIYVSNSQEHYGRELSCNVKRAETEDVGTYLFAIYSNIRNTQDEEVCKDIKLVILKSMASFGEIISTDVRRNYIYRGEDREAIDKYG